MIPAWIPASSADGWVRLVGVLGHTLWQAPLAALLLWAWLRRTPASQPNHRYLASGVTLAAILAAALFTWSMPAFFQAPPDSSPKHASPPGAHQTSPEATRQVPSQASSPVKLSQPVSLPSPRLSASASSSSSISSPAQPSSGTGTYPWARLLGSLWLAGVAAMLFRLIGSALGAGRLGRLGTPLEDPALLRMLEELCDRLCVAATVRLRVSESLTGPAIVGALCPVVLLPASLVTGIPAEHLRAILAHELAHVRRHDYLVNIGQMLVEALLFFNPAVWWVSRQMRIEREACCDALARSTLESPADYASALELVARRASAPFYVPEAAPAFASHGRGALAERVRRVLFPAQTPRMRLPWYTLLLSLLLWGAILAGLGLGSAATLALAARILTPAERLEAVKAQSRQYGSPARSVPESERGETTITGVLRYESGAPARRQSRVDFTSYIDQRNSHSGSIEVRGDDGRFEWRVPSGDIYLSAFKPGYAPALVGPLQTQKDQTTGPIELILRPGFTAKVRLTDENDKPLSGVLVSSSYWIYFSRGASSRGGEQSALSGADGVAELTHFCDHPVELRASLSGYQWDKKDNVRLREGEPYVWKLARAKPTQARIVDARSGAPVAGAALCLVHVDSPAMGYEYGLHSATTVTVSAADGGVSLTQLRNDSSYTFVVDAPPRRRAWFGPVFAGQSGLVVRMGDPLYVRGFVARTARELQASQPWLHGKLEISIASSVEMPRAGYGPSKTQLWEERTVPTEQRDGQSWFYLDNLFEGKQTLSFSLYNPPKTVTLDLHSPIEQLDVEATKKPEQADKAATRTVVIHFDVPPGAPPPSGTMSFCSSQRPGEDAMTCAAPTAITGQDMRFTVTVPAKVMCRSEGTLGYWFPNPTPAVEVPKGEGEYVVKVPCQPAGSIGGQVVGASGKPLPTVSVLLTMLKEPPDPKRYFSPPGYMDVNSEGRFLATPLALEATYQVMASAEEAVAVSKPLVLDGAHPTAQVELKIPEGVTVAGELLTLEGKPLPAVPVTLWYESAPGRTTTLKNMASAPDGKFMFSHVNPDAPGRYGLTVDSVRDYQPLALQVDPRAARALKLEMRKGLVLEGRVVKDSRSAPVENVGVLAIPDDPGAVQQPFPMLVYRAESPTDNQGRFRFTNLDDRTYRFQVTGAELKADPKARPGYTKSVELRITKTY